MCEERALLDEERQLHVIQSVTPSGEDWWTLGLGPAGNLMIGCPRSSLITPKIGDVATLWGRGFGSPVRGLAINDVVLWYRSATEDAAHRGREQERDDAQARDRYERGERAKHDTVIARLPEVFQRRLHGFRERNPSFGWRYEAYELMCCVDAVRIAVACGDAAEVERFITLGWEEQLRRVPDLDQGHSGNSLGAACLLARVFLDDPTQVPRVRGALSPLVGSEEYGDWSASPAGAAERERRGL